MQVDMMVGKSTPKAPDPYQTAAAQSAANEDAVRASAQYSAVDQYAPWGSTTFNRRSDGTPQSQTITLSPEAFQTYDYQVRAGRDLAGAGLNRVGELAQNSFDESTLPYDLGGLDISRTVSTNGLVGLPGIDDFGAERGRVEDAVYGRQMRLLEPQIDQRRKELGVSLGERGIPVGSEIYVDEMDRLGRLEQEAQLNAADAAVQAGGAEQSRLFGLAQGARGQQFTEMQGIGADQSRVASQQAALRQQALAEALAGRTQDINEISAFLQGGQALNSPQFQNTPAYNIGAPNVMDAVYASNKANNDYRATRNASINEGLFGIAAGLLF